jgi:ribosomal protein S18 acetylase RimI-like enzyme
VNAASRPEARAAHEPAVRRAGAPDIEPLAELWLALLRHHAAIDPAFALRPRALAELASLLAAQLRDPESALFVCEREGRSAGMCSVRIERAPALLAEGARAHITELCVDAAQRRRGIGAALARAALAWARERGAERVEVRVAAGNGEGQRFWRSLGFGPFVDVLHRRL